MKMGSFGQQPDDRPPLPSVSWQFLLRREGRDFLLPEGTIVVGRSPACDLVLEDPSVSPHHARIVVDEDSISVTDLVSLGAVSVNGRRVSGSNRLSPGDTVSFGSVVFSLVAEKGDDGDRAKDSDWPTRLAIRSPFASQPPPPKPVEGSQGLDVLGGLIDEALALGRAEAIAPIVTTRFSRLVDECETGKDVRDEALSFLARYCAKLAAATGNGDWFNLLVRAYLARAALLPSDLINVWYATLRRAQGVDWGSLRNYVALVRSRAGQMSAADRFTTQRIEGLLKYAPRTL